MTLPTSVETAITETIVDDILDDDELLEEIVRTNVEEADDEFLEEFRLIDDLYGEEDDEIE